MKRKRQPKPITRTEARRLAGDYLLRSLLRSAAVKDGGKVRWCPSYGAEPIDRSAVWLLFLPDQSPEPVFRSSEVIAVCKHTGRILYHGSANDEG